MIKLANIVLHMLQSLYIVVESSCDSSNCRMIIKFTYREGNLQDCSRVSLTCSCRAAAVESVLLVMLRDSSHNPGVTMPVLRVQFRRFTITLEVDDTHGLLMLSLLAP